jgi:FAD dependent oxidoreductase
MASDFTLLVISDELETLVGALVASWQGMRVTVLRRSTHWLGGLSTRGGLSYMDLTPDLISPVLAWVVAQAGLKRVALEPNQTSAVLWRLLAEAGVSVHSGVDWHPVVEDVTGRLVGLKDLGTGRQWQADVYWDGTPDARLARAVGVPYLAGLCDVFVPDTACAPDERIALNTLGVSPVFRLASVSAQELVDFEARLRAHPHTPTLLAQVFPHLSAPQQADLLTRPTYCPPESDYLDILNPVIGAWFHEWRYGVGLPYEAAPFWIDGANIARLSDGTLGFNGLVGRVESLAQALALSEERQPIPASFHQAMADVQQFLRAMGPFPTAEVLPPVALYVRQTAQIQAQHNGSGRHVLQGGCPADQAVGSFSYWLDFRGVHPWQAYPDCVPLPKPVFNVDLSACLPLSPADQPDRWGNLVVISRAAGYSPVSQSTCRIVQHNALLAEAMACALPLALAQAGGSASGVISTAAVDIRRAWQLVADRVGCLLPPVQGVDVLADNPVLASAPWLARDAAVVAPDGPWRVDPVVDL